MTLGAVLSPGGVVVELRGLGVVLYSVLPVLPFGSVVVCVMRDPVILGSALCEGYLISLYRLTVYSVWFCFICKAGRKFVSRYIAVFLPASP